MTSWLTILSALAEKATPGPWDFLGDVVAKPELDIAADPYEAIGRPRSTAWPANAEFIAACSPERVRALCELAGAAQAYLDSEDEWHIRYGMGRERIPYRHAMDDARLRLLAALASLEPAREEET